MLGDEICFFYISLFDILISTSLYHNSAMKSNICWTDRSESSHYSESWPDLDTEKTSLPHSQALIGQGRSGEAGLCSDWLIERLTRYSYCYLNTICHHYAANCHHDHRQKYRWKY